MKTMNTDRLSGVVLVTEEAAVPPEALPDVITAGWLEKRLSEFTDSLQFDVAMVVDKVVKHRLAQDSRYMKPVMPISEAAELLGLSAKRFTNIVYEEKKRLGRLPDFICDANGTMQRRVIKDELLKWAKKRKRRPGRPFKNERKQSS